MRKNKKESFFFRVYSFFYTLQNGYSPESGKEIKRVDIAIEKVEKRQSFLRKDFKKNRDEIFRLLSVYSKLVNYKCELSRYWDNSGIIRHPVFNEAGDSTLVDEVLNYKW